MARIKKQRVYRESKAYKRNKEGYYIPPHVDQEANSRIATMFRSYLAIRNNDLSVVAQELDTTVSEILWYLKNY